MSGAQSFSQLWQQQIDNWPHMWPSPPRVCRPQRPEGERLTDGHWSRGAEEPDMDPLSRGDSKLLNDKMDRGGCAVACSKLCIQCWQSVIDPEMKPLLFLKPFIAQLLQPTPNKYITTINCYMYFFFQNTVQRCSTTNKNPHLSTIELWTKGKQVHIGTKQSFWTMFYKDLDPSHFKNEYSLSNNVINSQIKMNVSSPVTQKRCEQLLVR